MDSRRLGEHLTIAALDGGPIFEATCDFAPASHLIHEWREYLIEWVSDSESPVELTLSGLSSDVFRTVRGALALTFSIPLGGKSSQLDRRTLWLWRDIRTPSFSI